jgi:hypothetical protein
MRRSRWPKRGIAIVGVITVVAVGIVGASKQRTTTRVASTTATPVRSPSGPPASVAAVTGPGSAVGGGPVAAAVHYVASLPVLARSSPVGRRELLWRLTTSVAFGVQVKQLEETLDRMDTTFGFPIASLRWVEAPLTATVEHSADGRVRVAVWSVAAVGGGDLAPQQMWRTMHVTLAETLVGGEWLVDEVSSTEGPTPSASPAHLPGTTAEFVTVAGWAPVVEGERL